MMILPVFIRFRFCHKGWWMPTLWLPIFILWPLLFLLLFIAFLVGLLFVAFLDARSLSGFTRLFAGFYRTLCEFRGTQIDVTDHENKIFIAID